MQFVEVQVRRFDNKQAIGRFTLPRHLEVGQKLEGIWHPNRLCQVKGIVYDARTREYIVEVEDPKEDWYVTDS